MLGGSLAHARPVAVAVAALCFVARPAFGDPHPITLGHHPAPVESTEVAIAREDLDIEIDWTRARVAPGSSASAWFVRWRSPRVGCASRFFRPEHPPTVRDRKR